MAVLITGGAGYIGSHTVAEFMANGEEVIVLDHLGQGHRAAVLCDAFYEGRIDDEVLLRNIFARHDIEAVIHFAASSLVGESMQDPLKYYANNVTGTQILVRNMLEQGIDKIVFSSTAATYGEPIEVPIPEDHPTRPTNPYGETKLAIERMLAWCEAAHGLKSVCLRYFNAAGAHPEGLTGEDHHPETHLIPIILQVALGQRPSISIYGDDYDTPDGTCVRDYIHVTDLAQAHWLSLQRLRNNGSSTIYNLGNGQGFTVKEVIEAARKVTGKDIPAVTAERRAGDPAVLVASSARIRRELGWQPQYQQLETIIDTAWRWMVKHPHGYGVS